MSTERSPETVAFLMQELARHGADGAIIAWCTAGEISEDHVDHQFHLQQQYPTLLLRIMPEQEVGETCVSSDVDFSFRLPKQPVCV